jgi:uncharacterized protein
MLNKRGPLVVSLVYNVSTLLREEIGATREYDVDDRALVDIETPRHERVAGRVTLLRTKEGVLATAHLRGEQSDACSRCLRTVAVPMELELEEEFFATTDVRTGARLARPGEPEAFLISPQQQLDLEEAVRQAWLAAQPMQPLCRADCQGLCPKCGKDWNEGPCSCVAEEDERWGPLRRLRMEMEGT